LTVSFYTYLFSILVACAHGIYVFAFGGFRTTQLLIRYTIATLLSFLCFLPWLWIVLSNYKTFTSTGSVQQKLSLIALTKTWLRQLSFLFFDLQNFYTEKFSYDSPSTYWHPLFYLMLVVLVLVGYSLYLLYCQASKQACFFIFILIVANALPLVEADLFLGWRLSSVSRYLIPAYLGTQIAIAHFLATRSSNFNSYLWKQKTKGLLLSAIFTLGAISCLASSQSQTSWIKTSSYYNPQIVNVINQSSQPLVISYSSGMGEIFSLSHQLHKNTKLLLLPNILGSKLTIPELSDNFSQVFFLDFHQLVTDELQEQPHYQFKNVRFFENTKLWILDRK
jgi:uncharacterized membrane protein